MAIAARIHRMVTDKHICPFGLKALDLLEREGFAVEDRHLRDRDATEAFKQKHGVATTPQIWIEDERVGGYEDLRRHLGLEVRDPDALTYRPVVAVFAVAAAMALAANHAIDGRVLSIRSLEWFIAISMCILAILKLRDLRSFSNMFLGYDVLARRVVRYAYVYPFAEAAAGVLMIAGGVWALVAAPIALFIGTVGAWSVLKAVYIDKRELKCACVGGNSNVPLGFISLTENLMMIAMALWMSVRWVI